MKQDTLKNKYRLEYDTSGFPSSLIRWYNQVIDKSVGELNVSDVSRMIRQNILPDVAIERAIELFLDNTFDYEMREGDLLELLAVHSTDVMKNNRVQALTSLILKLGDETDSFDWSDEDSRMRFEKNLMILKQALL